MARWRTVQFFIYHYGVCEVQLDVDEKDGMRCTCPMFDSKSRCNHSKWVRMRMNINQGHYPLQLTSKNMDENVLLNAVKNPDLFRDLVLHHTRIEVID
jgi:hypothetical protein